MWLCCKAQTQLEHSCIDVQLSSLIAVGRCHNPQAAAVRAVLRHCSRHCLGNPTQVPIHELVPFTPFGSCLSFFMYKRFNGMPGKGGLGSGGAGVITLHQTWNPSSPHRIVMVDYQVTVAACDARESGMMGSRGGRYLPSMRNLPGIPSR